jgi:hypothetical protein
MFSSHLLIKQLLVNSGFAGVAFGFVKAAVVLALQAGNAAPSSFWQGFAMVLLTSLMTITKWYFDDRKSSRANAATLAELKQEIADLRQELTQAKVARPRRTRR